MTTNFIFASVAIGVMFLGLAGMLPYIDTALPLDQPWDANQYFAAFNLALQAALLSLGAIMLAVTVR